MDNITMDTVPEQSVATTQPVNITPQTPLIKVDIVDENVALNVMVSFLNVAQRRGAFDMAESAKIWECVQRFITPQSQEAANAQP
jgi:hypothetical protein